MNTHGGSRKGAGRKKDSVVTFRHLNVSTPISKIVNDCKKKYTLTNKGLSYKCGIPAGCLSRISAGFKMIPWKYTNNFCKFFKIDHKEFVDMNLKTEKIVKRNQYSGYVGQKEVV